MTSPQIVCMNAAVPIELIPIERPGIPSAPGSPREYGSVDFVSSDHGFAAGIWQGEAGVISIAGYPVDEFCLILEGEVILTSKDGARQTFTPGMSFIVPRGFEGTWEMPVRSKKYFASHGTAQMVALLLGSAASAVA